MYQWTPSHFGRAVLSSHARQDQNRFQRWPRPMNCIHLGSRTHSSVFAHVPWCGKAQGGRNNCFHGSIYSHSISVIFNPRFAHKARSKPVPQKIQPKTLFYPQPMSILIESLSKFGGVERPKVSIITVFVFHGSMDSRPFRHFVLGSHAFVRWKKYFQS